jgi:hypothetical protein
MQELTFDQATEQARDAQPEEMYAQLMAGVSQLKAARARVAKARVVLSRTNPNNERDFQGAAEDYARQQDKLLTIELPNVMIEAMTATALALAVISQRVEGDDEWDDEQDVEGPSAQEYLDLMNLRKRHFNTLINLVEGMLAARPDATMPEGVTEAVQYLKEEVGEIDKALPEVEAEVKAETEEAQGDEEESAGESSAQEAQPAALTAPVDVPPTQTNAGDQGAKSPAEPTSPSRTDGSAQDDNEPK